MMVSNRVCTAFEFFLISKWSSFFDLLKLLKTKIKKMVSIKMKCSKDYDESTIICIDPKIQVRATEIINENYF